MTEQDWLTHIDCVIMLQAKQCQLSPRKLQLFESGVYFTEVDMPLELTQFRAVLLRDIVGNPWKPHPPLTHSVKCDRCNGKGKRTINYTCGTCKGTGSIIGTADWLDWNGPIPLLARSIYEECEFDNMLILADALEEIGCTDNVIIDHCRNNLPHIRGCWVIDLILGLE